MKDQQKDTYGKNTGKTSAKEKQDKILNETALRYEQSNELYAGEFEKALRQILPQADADIEAEIQATLNGTDKLKPNPFSAMIKRLRIDTGLSIDELSHITGVDVQALESGDKDKMTISDTKKVLEYLTKGK
jgi:DNA-binding transcriptional regulator YiaG